ncbi:MAG: hypothetical protein Q4C00_06910 [Bacillota bacterium]|nr:hypothetical protein [Bacillota bacterium]
MSEHKHRHNGDDRHCDHEHEGHRHDEHCGCGHEDHRDCGLSFQHHDGAIIANYQAELPCSREEAQKKAQDFMVAIGNKVQALGGVVGHIKALVTTETGVFISLTAGEPQTAPIQPKAWKVKGAAIVLNVPEEKFKEAVHSLFHEIL